VRHDEERWAGVEVVSAAAELVATSSGMAVLFEHGDVQAVLGQVGRCGDPTQTGADNQDGCLAHSFT
jgi:hypothetical protein